LDEGKLLARFQLRISASVSVLFGVSLCKALRAGAVWKDIGIWLSWVDACGTAWHYGDAMSFQCRVNDDFNGSIAFLGLRIAIENW
jgi:hypothetical protein